MRQFGKYFTQTTLVLLLLTSTSLSLASTVNVAVASNFISTLRQLTPVYEKKHGHQLKISSASTGKLYSQIIHGAPFDIFMSADEARPNRLISEGKTSDNLAAIYATGKLVLVSHQAVKGDCTDALKSSSLKRLAIANPKTAPYGRAAQESLNKLGLWNQLRPKIVMGENIAQTLQFVSTKSADTGLIAKSMLTGNILQGACQWDIPEDYHTPINQKMVVLKKSAQKPGVTEFFKFMTSADAIRIIKQSGYATP